MDGKAAVCAFLKKNLFGAPGQRGRLFALNPPTTWASSATLRYPAPTAAWIVPRTHCRARTLTEFRDTRIYAIGAGSAVIRRLCRRSASPRRRTCLPGRPNLRRFFTKWEILTKWGPGPRSKWVPARSISRLFRSLPGASREPALPNSVVDFGGNIRPTRTQEFAKRISDDVVTDNFGATRANPACRSRIVSRGGAEAGAAFLTSTD